MQTIAVETIAETAETSERTNAEWVSDLRASDDRRSGALEDLHRHLVRGLTAYLRSQRSDLSDLHSDEIEQMAQDFAQQTLLTIQNKLETFEGRSKFTTWASKIAVHHAISELRRARWRDVSLDQLLSNGEWMPASDAHNDPNLAARRSEVWETLREVIENELTERQRNALIAVHLHGVTQSRLAEALDTNPNALYKLMHDARRKLKNRLAERGMTEQYIFSLYARDE